MNPCEHCGKIMVHPADCPENPGRWPDKPKWTPGPWAVVHRFPTSIAKAADQEKGLGAAVDPEYDKSFAQKIATSHYDKYVNPQEFPHRITDKREAEANAALIVSCVNAMEGIGRPEKVKDLIEAVKYIRDDLLKNGGEHDIPAVIDTALAALEME